MADSLQQASDQNIIDVALQHANAGIRKRALEQALSSAAIDSSVLFPMLKDPNLSIRRMALAAVGKQRDGQSVEAVGQVLLCDSNPGICRLAAEILGTISLPACLPYLREGFQRDIPATVQIACAKSLCQLGDPEAAGLFLKRLTASADPNLTAFLLTCLGNLRSLEAIPLLIDSLANPASNIRNAALRALYQVSPDQALEPGRRLLREDPEGSVRKHAADTLGALRHPAAVPDLVRAFFFDPITTARQASRDALLRIDDWQAKTDAVLRVLAGGRLRREDLDGSSICAVIAPPQDPPHLFSDYLIKQAVHADNQMLNILAALLVSGAGGSQDRAGERLNDHAVAAGLPAETLRDLRVAIGGKTALDPILQALHDDLETYFQQPIHTLNTQTQTSWHSAIRYAQIGFLTRMLMSFTVFVVGLVLLWLSASQLLLGQRSAGELFGPGITFVTGLGTMLLIVYSGPLREIRQSVSDLGAANAVFIAYIHRVLQISHTFSLYYIGQKMTFTEMEQSSRLISEALTQAVTLLNQEGGRDSESVLQDALKTIAGMKKGGDAK